MVAAGEERIPEQPAGEPKDTKEEQQEGEAKHGNFAAIQASGFGEFLLQPEMLRAMVDCGFEHPSEVQHGYILQVILGTNVFCQAKPGTGKTAMSM